MRETRVDFTIASGGSRSAYLTYEPYYGLREKPFSLSADPRFLYKSRVHEPTFEELRSAIRRREGLITLTGEPGTGKTTLCRTVVGALDRKTFCTFVPDPFVSREDLLKMLLLDFGVMSVDDLKSGRLSGASRLELSYPLYEFLKSLVPLQAYAVLIIDEAQNLSQQLLEEVRILSDLEGPEKLLQLVLVGQPELNEKLKDPALRQVDQRISARCSLQPLEREAVYGYLAHRLTVAARGADRVEFSADAIDVMFAASAGNPRVINLIADRALHRGHQERTWLISPEIVQGAIGDLGLPKPRTPATATTTATTSFPVLDPEPAEDISAPLPDFADAVEDVPEAPSAAHDAPEVTPSWPSPERIEQAAPAPVPVADVPSAFAPVLAVEVGTEATMEASTEDGLHIFSAETEAPAEAVPSETETAAPDLLAHRDTGSLRRVGFVAAAILVVALAGAAARWQAERAELVRSMTLPQLPPRPSLRMGSSAAPVVPPADAYAPVLSTFPITLPY